MDCFAAGVPHNRVELALKAVGEVIATHDDVVQRVRALEVPPGDCLTLVVGQTMARGEALLHSATLLYEREQFEAAAILTRALLEGAITLCYIASRPDSRDRLARLLLLSGYPYLHEHSEELLDGGAIAATVCAGKQEFEALRAALWEGARKTDGRPKDLSNRTWNGLNVRQTFERAGASASYKLLYRPLCWYVHSSPLAAQWHPQPARPVLPAALVLAALLDGMGSGMSAVSDLLGVKPDGGYPDIGEVMALVNDAFSRSRR